MRTRSRPDPQTLAGLESLVEAPVRASSLEGGRASDVVLECGGNRYGLPPGETIIGRDCTSDIVVSSPGVSRRHARIHVADGCVTVEDLGSRNGTYVDEHRIDLATEIRDSVAIRVGPVWFMLRSVTETQ